MTKVTSPSPAKKLSYAQKVKSVNSNRVRGDVRSIAVETNYHPDHVSNVLSGRRRNDDIVNAAYNMIRARKQK
jgi:hypothetical protein